MADTLYDAIALEVAQGLCEHLLRDAPNHAHQFTRPHWAILEAAQDKNRPFTPDQVEYFARRAVEIIRISRSEHILKCYLKVRTCTIITVAIIVGYR